MGCFLVAYFTSFQCFFCFFFPMCNGVIKLFPASVISLCCVCVCVHDSMYIKFINRRCLNWVFLSFHLHFTGMNSHNNLTYFSIISGRWSNIHAQSSTFGENMLHYLVLNVSCHLYFNKLLQRFQYWSMILQLLFAKPQCNTSCL